MTRLACTRRATSAAFFFLAAAGAAHAQSSVTLYGRLNTALEHSWVSGSGNDQSGTRMTNNRSVFGLRGTEALGGGWSAVFQIESGISLATGQGQIASRNTRVGLDSPYGTFFLGQWHTAYTESTTAFDPYYPTTAGYMSLIGNGSAAQTDNVENTSSFDRRQKNSLHYRSPIVNGFSGGFSWGLPQERGVDPRNPQLFSWSGKYTDGALSLVLAYELHRNYQAAGTQDHAIKTGVSYQFPTTLVSLVFEQLRYETPTGTLSRKGYYASVKQQLWGGNLIGAVGVAANGTGSARQAVGFVSSGPDTGAIQYTLGYDYALSKRTSLYTYYSKIKNRGNAAYDFAINDIPVSAGASPQTLAIGLRHYF